MSPSKIKCVVWDLDNTIWEGILLDKPSVQLKGGIVRIIKDLDQRGILHSIASRNDPEIALEKLAEFGLREYFLKPQIHWGAKSHSVKTIAEELNIGLDTIAFVDDDAFERAEVSNEHAAVRCYSDEQSLSFLELPDMTPEQLTADSYRRRHMYLEEEQRVQAELSTELPKPEFLRSLDLKLEIFNAGPDDLRRAEELTQRTNQLNTTGIPYGMAELDQFCKDETHAVIMAKLEDKFGSYGHIALCVLETTTSTWQVKLFINSCRVQSRGVGTIVLQHLLRLARDRRKQMTIDYRPTGRNRAMQVLLGLSGFELTKPDSAPQVYTHLADHLPGPPDYFKITDNTSIEIGKGVSV